MRLVNGLLFKANSHNRGSRLEHLSIIHYSILQVYAYPDPLFNPTYLYRPSRPPCRSSPAPQGTLSSPWPCCLSRPSGALPGRRYPLTCLCDLGLVCHQNMYDRKRNLLPCGRAVVGLHVETIVFAGGVV